MGGSSPTSTPVQVAPAIYPPGYGFSQAFYDQVLPKLIGAGYPKFQGSVDPGLSPTMAAVLRGGQTFAASPFSEQFGQAGATLGGFQNISYEDPLASTNPNRYGFDYTPQGMADAARGPRPDSMPSMTQAAAAMGGGAMPGGPPVSAPPFAPSIPAGPGGAPPGGKMPQAGPPGGPPVSPGPSSPIPAGPAPIPGGMPPSTGGGGPQRAVAYSSGPSHHDPSVDDPGYGDWGGVPVGWEQYIDEDGNVGYRIPPESADDANKDPKKGVDPKSPGGGGGGGNPFGNPSPPATPGAPAVPGATSGMPDWLRKALLLAGVAGAGGAGDTRPPGVLPRDPGPPKPPDLNFTGFPAYTPIQGGEGFVDYNPGSNVINIGPGMGAGTYGNPMPTGPYPGPPGGAPPPGGGPGGGGPGGGGGPIPPGAVPKGQLEWFGRWKGPNKGKSLDEVHFDMWRRGWDMGDYQPPQALVDAAKDAGEPYQHGSKDTNWGEIYQKNPARRGGGNSAAPMAAGGAAMSAMGAPAGGKVPPPQQVPR